MAGVAKAQTIKQAKASFASRGRPSLNAREQRQLERSLELEQRAERAKEQEKRRAAAAKKRAENETKSKAEREKAFLGTQRRKDRFGYVSSQFHMGAFLVGGKKAVNRETVMEEDEEEQEDDFLGDQELDDEDMLNALDAPAENIIEHAKSDSVCFMPPPPVPPTSAPAMDDMEAFWDDLESSTQIARELGETETEVAGKTTSTRSGSFGSVDFDLTAEDLDQLDLPCVAQRPLPNTREMMLPPPPANGSMLPPSIPVRQAGSTVHSATLSNIASAAMHLPAPTHTSVMAPPAKSVPTMPPPTKPAAKPVKFTNRPSQRASTSMPPPPAPPRRLHDTVPQQTKPRNAIKGPFLPASSLYCSPDLGFTLTQLESFVDDDIQLTQAVPG